MIVRRLGKDPDGHLGQVVGALRNELWRLYRNREFTPKDETHRIPLDITPPAMADIGMWIQDPESKIAVLGFKVAYNGAEARTTFNQDAISFFGERVLAEQINDALDYIASVLTAA